MKFKFFTTACRSLLLGGLVLSGAAAASGQQPGQQQAAAAPPAETPAPAATPAAPARTGDQYRIGPADVLSVRVVAARLVPEFSMDSVEVNGCGMIPLPSVQHEERNEIQAAGKTRSELAEELRQFYSKYKRNPQVMVTVREYNSQPVIVNGAVVKPSQFQLRRPVRLLELVQRYAGGKTNRAGGDIQVMRLPAFTSCTEAAPAGDEVVFLQFSLAETLGGVEAANPYLQPGDVVTVMEAKEAYLIGNVLRPGPVLLNEDGVTISRAIAMAGGTMPDTKKSKIRIVRIDEKTKEKKEIFVNLEAIDKQKAEDIALMPNDIIDVPVSGGKRVLRSLVGTVVPTVGQLPMQVIR